MNGCEFVRLKYSKIKILQGDSYKLRERVPFSSATAWTAQDRSVPPRRHEPRLHTSHSYYTAVTLQGRLNYPRYISTQNMDEPSRVLSCYHPPSSTICGRGLRGRSTSSRHTRAAGHVRLILYNFLRRSLSLLRRYGQLVCGHLSSKHASEPTRPLFTGKRHAWVSGRAPVSSPVSSWVISSAKPNRSTRCGFRVS